MSPKNEQKQKMKKKRKNFFSSFKYYCAHFKKFFQFFFAKQVQIKLNFWISKSYKKQFSIERSLLGRVSRSKLY